MTSLWHGQQQTANATPAQTRLDLDGLFMPRSVAVVGASPNASFVSNILGSLHRYGYEGQVAAVNPRYERIEETPCYPSLLDVPGEVDLAVVGIAHRLVPGVLEQAERKGVRGVCVVTSGFSEVEDDAGSDRQAELAEWAARTRIPVLGPNCLGLLNAYHKMVAILPYWESMPAGEVGMVLQSGMMSGAMTLPLLSRGMGLTLGISTGNEAVIETADVIRYLAEDDVTRVIGTFTEQIKNPQKLIAACEAAAEAGKPIVMLKVGRSEGGRRSARAHTGSLVGDDDVIDAALRKLGVTRVRSVDEAAEAIALFHTRKLPRGRGVAAVSVSGGISGLLSDQAIDAGVEFVPLTEETKQQLHGVIPEYGSIANPLDITGQGVYDTEILQASLEALGNAPNIDVVMYAGGWPFLIDRQLPLGAGLERASEQFPDTIYLVLSMAAGKVGVGRYPHLPSIEPIDRIGGVPFLQGSERALQALASLFRYADFRRRWDAERSEGPPPRLTPPEAGARAREMVRAAAGRALTERESKEVLELYGIRVTREILARSADDAVGAAEAIGWPVALKVESPDLLHKTEAGAVLLNVEDADAVLDGYEEIVANARAAEPNATINGVLVQEMAPRGVETILGMTVDSQWGPAIALGIGGTLVEVLRDRQIVLPPVDTDEARSALGSLRAAKLFEGVRGAPPSDVAALADAIVRFSELSQDLADVVSEIDVNPLLVLPDGEGVLALDALIVPREPA